jgi:HEPN domain-containing protein
MKKMTREWVRKAEKDWLLAVSLPYAARAARDTFHDQLCFHCQQSAEKYFKALMNENGLPVPRIHDLEVLLAILTPQVPGLLRLQQAARVLTPYAVEYRYPGLNATKRKAEAALRHAEKVRAAVRARLGLSL